MPRESTWLIGKATGWLATGVFLSVALLFWFGYHAIQEWRQSALLLAERRSNEAVDLLVEALSRDMHGVQESVLASQQWQQFAGHEPYEMGSLVASAFARYPYPESFFAWKAHQVADRFWFFNRANRRPPWVRADPGPSRFPVVIEHDPDVARVMTERLLAEASHGRRITVFEVAIGAVTYQVVAQLTYADAFREHLSEVVGFTVNLPWVREHYFSDLAGQVWAIGAGAEKGLALSVTDGSGNQVAGVRIDDRGTLTNHRPFALAFVNPDAVLDLRADLLRRPWLVKVSAVDDPAVSQAIIGANRMLVIGGASALALALGLALAVRAQFAAARLAELRSDFVSTVTHELKTPIATIHAAAETLAQGRLHGIEAFRGYGRLVVTEAKRLTRLVENLLAYSRITDVADVYAFERLEVHVIFNDIQEEFETRLDEAGFDMQISIEPNTPIIQGDRLALRLLFDNLVDNAMRYSTSERRLALAARTHGGLVSIDVIDSGIGIPAEELPLVTRKFVRGKGARSGGSGLGLAIAARIARDHGGRLEIHSTVGSGTTVTVTLPEAAA
ncbi:MAG: HAMP domain-containing sensor histidine kinase [Vicinamibacterales bacterium]